MAQFEFIPNYVDTILVSDYEKEDYDKLIAAGYKPNDGGEIEVDMLFGDGIAYDTSMNGVVMRYPTLYEVSQSEKMQREIYNHCGERVCDHYEQWDVALTYGKVGRYKYVLDYGVWVKQGDNADKDIFAINVMDANGKSDHAFDVFYDEYDQLFEDGMIAGNFDDGGWDVLESSPSGEKLYEIQAKYGILWTENIGTRICL